MSAPHPLFQFTFTDGVLICPICQSPMHGRTKHEAWPNAEFGSKSNVIETTGTLMDFTSPPGHNHDHNCIKRVYVCPAEHTMRVSLRRKCPACDWMGQEWCPCHDGVKLDEWPKEPA